IGLFSAGESVNSWAYAIKGLADLPRASKPATRRAAASLELNYDRTYAIGVFIRGLEGECPPSIFLFRPYRAAKPPCTGEMKRSRGLLRRPPNPHRVSPEL